MKFKFPIVKSDALISNCGKHRYWLSRIWDETKPVISFIGLNPSRADQTFNDPTIIRCINFAQNFRYTYDEVLQPKFAKTDYHKYGGMYFLNLYSFRTPYPDDLIKAIAVGDAYTEDTDFNLAWKIKESKTVVCAWGSWKFIADRSEWVLREHIQRQDVEPMCFGTNSNGAPKHPLYLKSTTELIPYVRT